MFQTAHENAGGTDYAVSPPHSYAEILTPNEMGLGGGSLGGDSVMRMEPS